ncbi:enoyl-CoA hydratase/isomerase family protein [Oesophagostomum dentatum]|uniref:Enoyl-CoA hydratase/isomerase family protein n=1 Tax=Oesophagostomum dentatum TaxID=61180 RepID=A0A0B1TS00_OESDE|nr:enoyl-CoA hydratase/isomerase family protein [Oesophagostomum dentatum]
MLGAKSAVQSLQQLDPDLAKALHRWTGGSVELTVCGDIARLQLNRPDKSNCLSGEMMIQLRERTEELSSISGAGVLVVEGIGRSFCSGADLGMVNEVSTATLGCAVLQFMSASLANIHSSPLVSVARVHGHCVGGGQEIAACCDLRFAHKDAKIGFLQARMGIIPTWGGATYLPSIVGRSAALRLMTTAPILTAQEAKDLGFVDVIYDEEEEFESLIASMTKHGAEVCKAQKAMLNALGKGEEAELGVFISFNVLVCWRFVMQVFTAVVRSVWGKPDQKAAIQRQMNAVMRKKS